MSLGRYHNIYTLMLKQVQTIRFIDVGYVYDVCDIVNGDLLIPTNDGLYHTKANGKHSLIEA